MHAYADKNTDCNTLLVVLLWSNLFNANYRNTKCANNLLTLPPFVMYCLFFLYCRLN